MAAPRSFPFVDAVDSLLIAADEDLRALSAAVTAVRRLNAMILGALM